MTKILLSMVPLATSRRVDAEWSANLKLNRHRLQNRVSTAETTDVTGRQEAAVWRGSAEVVERKPIALGFGC